MHCQEATVRPQELIGTQETAFLSHLKVGLILQNSEQTNSAQGLLLVGLLSVKHDPVKQVNGALSRALYPGELKLLV
ncbi:hypothetical protein N7524_008666 [Penicillium chrysogenum]|nr:hypothetical protein N7524_008666 [Penicillium chrysogenum]